jgi:acyl carrier protein
MKEALSSESVLSWLSSWFASKARSKPRDIVLCGDVDYFEAGWLTSMEVVEFVMEIEQYFNMQFSEQNLQDVRFVTIDGLAELILDGSMQASENNVSTAIFNG